MKMTVYATGLNTVLTRVSYALAANLQTDKFTIGPIELHCGGASGSRRLFLVWSQCFRSAQSFLHG